MENDAKESIAKLLDNAIQLRKQGDLESSIIITAAAINRICLKDAISFETFLKDAFPFDFDLNEFRTYRPKANTEYKSLGYNPTKTMTDSN